MARSFSKQSRLHVISELNVTPMLDLCFVLLIIFMIATPVLEQTTAINLPKSDKGVGKAAESKTQYRFVTIGADGGLAIGNRAVNRQQLEAEFAQIAAMPEADQPIIRVRGDGGLAYQKIIDVLSLAKSKGLTKVALDSEIR
jgi:biopolymer transport protein ExbD